MSAPDQLEEMSDAELNEAFAVEVCGWSLGEARGEWIDDGRDLEKFSTSADAVLPWLEKHAEVSNVFEDGEWFVGIERKPAVLGSFVSATGPTFARAACIALIRAHRASRFPPQRERVWWGVKAPPIFIVGVKPNLMPMVYGILGDLEGVSIVDEIPDLRVHEELPPITSDDIKVVQYDTPPIARPKEPWRRGRPLR